MPGQFKHPPNDPILERRHPKLFTERHVESMEYFIFCHKFGENDNLLFFYTKLSLNDRLLTHAMGICGMTPQIIFCCFSWVRGYPICETFWQSNRIQDPKNQSHSKGINCWFYVLRRPEGSDWFSGTRMRLDCQKVSHMGYPHIQEKQQNAFWGVISHIPIACVSNISISDNFVKKKNCHFPKTFGKI